MPVYLCCLMDLSISYASLQDNRLYDLSRFSRLVVCIMEPNQTPRVRFGSCKTGLNPKCPLVIKNITGRSKAISLCWFYIVDQLCILRFHMFRVTEWSPIG